LPEIIDVSEKLPRNTQSRYWRLRPPGAIRTIVVHYDAVAVPPAGEGDAPGYDPPARYAAQARYHMEKNWNAGDGPPVRGFGLMYHYRVSADGRIWRTQPEGLVTWHARDANYAGLAVCCDLGPGQEPAQVQIAGLKALLDWLCTGRPDIPACRKDVWGHGELVREGNSTPCPGALLAWVRLYRNGQAA
jgi:hypothetical protein